MERLLRSWTPVMWGLVEPRFRRPYKLINASYKPFLVGGLVAFFIFPYIGNNHPNWLSYFSEGWPNHQSDLQTMWLTIYQSRTSGMIAFVNGWTKPSYNPFAKWNDPPSSGEKIVIDMYWNRLAAAQFEVAKDTKNSVWNRGVIGVFHGDTADDCDPGSQWLIPSCLGLSTIQGGDFFHPQMFHHFIDSVWFSMIHHDFASLKKMLVFCWPFLRDVNPSLHILLMGIWKKKSGDRDLRMVGIIPLWLIFVQ